MNTHFKLLKQINHNPSINLRELSRQCEISLGKVNALVDEMKYKNYIEKECTQREHKYLVTSLGLEYLENKLKKQQRTRLKLPTSKSVISSAVILAAGNNKSFEIPSALCEVKDSIKFKNLRDIICNILKVTDGQIQKISPIGGMTNKNYKVTIDNEHFVLRIPGNGTEEMINRDHEMQNVLYAYEVGLDAEVIYFDKETGIKVSKFIENAEALSPESARHYANMKLTTNILKKLHRSTKSMPTNFDIYEKIEEYQNIICKCGAKYYKNYEETREKVYALQEMLNTLEVKSTPCHNDLVAENLISTIY